MFICKKCFDKKYTHWVGLLISRGACEVCGKIADCDDLPHDYKFMPKIVKRAENSDFVYTATGGRPKKITRMEYEKGGGK